MHYQHVDDLASRVPHYLLSIFKGMGFGLRSTGKHFIIVELKARMPFLSPFLRVLTIRAAHSNH